MTLDDVRQLVLDGTDSFAYVPKDLLLLLLRVVEESEVVCDKERVTHSLTKAFEELNFNLKMRDLP